ncbi:thiamine pyrophosphate-binding protein [Clostridiales Family XIII bacterium BX16]|jgi:acetolactate synthase-1/2/3 large subunit|uniref:Thiamine pyrophosphate-binding protein n=1 Tax=Lentihominibacter faecis TaxID=2764712 RepID=A0A923NDR5_9FIRM|nr:thiamine pyrophosphate-binding protein [Lentihominibacter faecis]MBC5999534.1 thiamine pyrophosphate-binding protein [Lentihominibacter faecis]
MSKLKGYEYIGETLKANGTTHVFYEELAFFYSTKEMRKYGITPVLAHSEEAAGYMADGYARASNKIGVCMSQSIGAANLAASVHDAWLGNTPVLAMTGFKQDNAYQKGGYQESNHRAHFSGVTKYNETTYDAQQLPFLLSQAIREATTGKPRPVHLDVIGYAGEVAEKAEMNANFVPEPGFASIPAFRPAADPEAVKKAAEMINAAERPVFVAGRGALISDPDGKVLYEMATKADVPVCTTPDGKTIISEYDPLWGGVVGGYGMACANHITTDSDLVVYIGSMVSDQTTLAFTAPPLDRQIIHIDIDGRELGKNYKNTFGLQGDARTVMEQLLPLIEKKDRKDWRDKAAAYVAKSLKELDDMSGETVPVQTGRLCQEISKALPDDAIVVADTGWSATWADVAIRMKDTQKYMRAAGSLGWSFPASIGAKCACPDRPVFNFSGDGAFYYHLSELESSVRNGIKVIVILNNNSHFNQCIPYVSEAYEDDPEGFEVYAEKVKFEPTDFVGIAKSFGADGEKVTDSADIGKAIERAMASDVSYVINVITDPSCAPIITF